MQRVFRVNQNENSHLNQKPNNKKKTYSDSRICSNIFIVARREAIHVNNKAI